MSRPIIGFILLLYGTLSLFWLDSLRHFRQTLNYSHYSIPFSSRGSIYVTSLLEPFGAICLIILGLLVIIESAYPSQTSSSTSKFVFWAFGLVLVLSVGFLPCILMQGELCGVWAIVLGEFGSPIFIPLTVMHVYWSGNKTRQRLAILFSSAAVVVIWLSIALFAVDSPADCAQIPLEEPYSYEYNSCFFNFAEVLNEPELCASITSPLTRDSCFSLSASRSGNLTFCERIEALEVRQRCLGKNNGTETAPTSPAL